MPTDIDIVGPPIWPHLMQQRVSQRFFSAPQLAEQVGIATQQAEQVTETLIQEGFVQPWLAPQCPNCDCIWAAFIGEDDIPRDVHCPFCGEATPDSLMEFYLVYERLKELPD
jgi:hypothetical protein